MIPNRRKEKRRSWGALVMTIILAGCGQFSARNPQEPIGEIPRRTPNQPDSVIWNLESGIQFKLGGVNQISETFDNDLVFRLDPADARSLGIPDSLNRAQVERGFGAFFEVRVEPDSMRADVKLEENERVEHETGGIDLYVNVPYEMTAFRGRFESGQVKEKVAGVADISFRQKTDGNWVIVRWLDKASLAAANTLGYWLGFYSGAS